MTLSLALSYSGRRDVVDAMRTIAARARAGLLLPEDIDTGTLRATSRRTLLPDVDLLSAPAASSASVTFSHRIGLRRALLHRRALADFAERRSLDAFQVFSGRERRFGRTGEQVRLTA